jgi:hypothetical protein
MNKIKTKTVGRVTAAAALSLGLAASAVSVASASTHGSRHGGRHGFADGTNWTKGFGGVVTAVTATSVTVTGRHGTSSAFVITPTTTFAEGSTTVLPAALVVGDRIEIQVSSSATTTATSIGIRPAWSIRLGGLVTAVTATSVTVIGRHGTSSTFVITPTTTFSEGSTTVLPAVLVVGSSVDIQVSSSAITTATSIDIDLTRFGGEVTVVSGDTITILGHDGVSSTILVGTTTTFSKGGATAALTDVAAGLYVSAQGVIGATPTTLDASSVTIGGQCHSSGASQGANHSDSNSRSEGNDQGSQGNQGSHSQGSHGRGFAGRGSSHHGNSRR